jgi:hypothetical protein
MSERRVATPEDYARCFEGSPAGQVVYEDLVRRFAGLPYVRGGLEADRETCYRAGQNRVVNFILARINQANGVSDPNAEED